LQGCKNLRELLLWGNSIQRIDMDTFAGLWNLRKLDLDRNRISTLSRGAFTHLSALEVVHLGENRIEEIHGDTFILAKSLKVNRSVTTGTFLCIYFSNKGPFTLSQVAFALA